MHKQLKQLPVIDTSTRALDVPAPFDFIEGRRRNVETGVAIQFLAAQQQLAALGKHQNANLSEDQQVEAMARMQRTLLTFLQATVVLFNACIVTWNLDEYARRDGQAYSPAGQLTSTDVLQMPDELRNALVGAVMSKDKTAEADQKKG